MHPLIWKASGHTDAFNDPLIDNKDSKKRYRADELIEKSNKQIDSAKAKAIDELKSISVDLAIKAASKKLIKLGILNITNNYHGKK